MSSSSITKKLSLSGKLSRQPGSVQTLTKQESNNQSSLLAVVDDNLLVWSRDDCCFYAQHLLQEDAPIQTLCVTRPPLWSVQRIAVNSSGTAVLLVGRCGVGVVDLPQRWGKHHTFDGGSNNITCRIEFIAERFLVCQQRVAVVAAKWHPAHQSHVLLLATDHYLRVYSLRSRDVPEQALAISVSRPDNIFSRHAGQPVPLGLAAEEPVDFVMGAPILPPNKDEGIHDVGDDGTRSVTSSELQWPVFVLYTNGDVYHCYLAQHTNKVRSRSVNGPLVMQPPRQDNYGLEWCSVGWLGEAGAGGGVLVLATNGGNLHHAVIMPPPPPTTAPDSRQQHDLKDSLAHLSLSNPAVSLYVYESVDLELALCPLEEAAPCPLMVVADATSFNRYLVVHRSGVHAVTVTLVDSLRQLTGDSHPGAGAECECIVEHLLCSRALASSPALPVVGATVHMPLTLSSTELLVLMGSGAIMGIPLPPPLPTSLPVDDVKSKQEKSDNVSSGECFESVIRRVLQRGASQPALACGGAGGQPDPLEALDLTNRTLHTLRTQYITPQAEALQMIMHRVRVLCDQQRGLCSQLSDVQCLRVQSEQRTTQLQARMEETKDKQADISDRLDAIVSSALRRVPGLSGGERWFIKQLQSVQEQLPHLHGDLQHLRTKLHWHDSQPPSATPETADLKLSQNQLHSLKKSIGLESEKIEKLVGRCNNIKKNLEY